eukprot:6213286-Pleurochrysis_carterae.AAC.2
MPSPAIMLPVMLDCQRRAPSSDLTTSRLMRRCQGKSNWFWADVCPASTRSGSTVARPCALARGPPEGSR